jgi:hypothetical protein
MGSDTNIIAASAAALADSIEYAIWKTGAQLRRRDERHFTTATPVTGRGEAGRTNPRASPSPSRPPTPSRPCTSSAGP